MVLPTRCERREPAHRRTIEVQAFLRADGLWELEAQLRDLKPRDWVLSTGEVRAVGQPIHDLFLRLHVQDDGVIVQSGSMSQWVPHPGYCEFGQDDDPYQALVGLNLLRDFRRQSLQRLVGVRGCTHLTELAQTLPTALIQAQVERRRAAQSDPAREPQRPFQIDRCHALRADGEVVRLHHPRWYRQPDAKNGEHNDELAVTAGARSQT